MHAIAHLLQPVDHLVSLLDTIALRHRLSTALPKISMLYLIILYSIIEF